MSPFEILAIVALTGWAVYKQTRAAEVTHGLTRFKMAAFYAAVGVVLGGFTPPGTGLGVAFLVVSLLLSVVVGLVRARLTRIWVDADGRLLRQGTPVTVTWFLGLIVAKFALGTVAYFWHVQDGAGLGEIMVMIAIMIAVQAELVHRRGTALRAVEPASTALGISRTAR